MARIEGEQLSPERFQKADAIFQGALKLPEVQRRAYLDNACGADADLRREVESLLKADAQGGLMDGSAFDAFNTAQIADAVNDWNNPSKPEKATMQRCKEGHFYDETQHTVCPYCPIAGLVVDKTVPVAREASPRAPGSAAGQDQPTTPKPFDEGATQGHYKAKLGIEPVVGWLVCVKGPDRGRDYRIRSQRNFIGRDPRMDICIAGDNQISRENHAAVTYDPRSNTFRFTLGDSRSLAYLNSVLVEQPMPLKPYDLIELGETHLRFVPFCGESFQWE